MVIRSAEMKAFEKWKDSRRAARSATLTEKDLGTAGNSAGRMVAMMEFLTMKGVLRVERLEQY